MNPRKVDRARVRQLTDLPNVGRAVAALLHSLGIQEPGQLVGLNPYEMYDRLCQQTGTRHDPCVIDVFISITHFMNGEAPRPWWEYTRMRKQAISGAPGAEPASFT